MADNEPPTEKPPIDIIAQVLTQAIIDALKDRQDELTAIAEAGGAKAGGGLLGDIGSLASIITSVLLSVALSGDPPAALTALAGAAGKLPEGIGLGYFLGYAAWQFAEPFTRGLLQATNELAVRTGIFQTLDIDTVARMVNQGIIKEVDAYKTAKKLGYSEQDFIGFVTSDTTRPGLPELFELYRRQAINQTDFETGVHRLGYGDFWSNRIPELVRQLLTPADLAIAVIKGRMEIGQAKDYAGTLGMLAPDFQTLVDTTGDAPGPEQLMEALRREIIKPDRFKTGILEGRLRDEWVDMMLALRFQPMSTADAVRARVENYLNDEQAKAITTQNGLLEEHYPILVEAWGRPLSHEQMLTLYHRGEATLDEVRQAFKESDLKDKYSDKAILLGRTLIPERTLVSMIDHGVLDRPTGFELLKERGYNDADANRLIELGVAQRTSSHKTLTKAEILALYSDALINRRQAGEHLAKLGYQPADAEEMIDLADYKRKASSLRILERGVQASLKAHRLTQEQAMSQLEQAGLDHLQARILVDEWLQERRIATRSLSEKQIIDAIGGKIISLEDGRTRLAAEGFSSGDIDIIFKLNALIPI